MKLNDLCCSLRLNRSLGLDNRTCPWILRSYRDVPLALGVQVDRKLNKASKEESSARGSFITIVTPSEPSGGSTKAGPQTAAGAQRISMSGMLGPRSSLFLMLPESLPCRGRLRVLLSFVYAAGSRNYRPCVIRANEGRIGDRQR